MRLDNDRPTAARHDRQDKALNEPPKIVLALLRQCHQQKAEKHCDYEQRQQPEHPIVQEKAVIDPPILDQLGKQIPAENHEQRDAAMARVDQSDLWCAGEGHRATAAMV